MTRLSQRVTAILMPRPSDHPLLLPTYQSDGYKHTGVVHSSVGGNRGRNSEQVGSKLQRNRSQRTENFRESWENASGLLE